MAGAGAFRNCCQIIIAHINEIRWIKAVPPVWLATSPMIKAHSKKFS